MSDRTRTLGRREFLRTAAGTATLSGVAGVVGAQEEKKTVTVEVGPGGDYTFVPGTNQPLYIKPGTSVEFVWKSDNHNIVVGSQPDGADWQGTPGGQSKTYNEGYTYSHTFVTKGKYHYWCQPHKPLGMVADIVVSETGKPPSTPSGGGGPQVPEVPESAKILGIAASAGMVATLGLGYMFLKYGGDYAQKDAE